MGISGAAGWYCLFEYDDLAEATKLLASEVDVAAAEAIILKYEERNASYLAHPDIEDKSPCCNDGHGYNGEAYEVSWSIDDRQYYCAGCEDLVDI
jgi:hypothetical protein